MHESRSAGRFRRATAQTEETRQTQPEDARSAELKHSASGIRRFHVQRSLFPSTTSSVSAGRDLGDPLGGDLYVGSNDMPFAFKRSLERDDDERRVGGAGRNVGRHVFLATNPRGTSSPPPQMFAESVNHVSSAIGVAFDDQPKSHYHRVFKQVG